MNNPLNYITRFADAVLFLLFHLVSRVLYISVLLCHTFPIISFSLSLHVSVFCIFRTFPTLLQRLVFSLLCLALVLLFVLLPSLSFASLSLLFSPVIDPLTCAQFPAVSYCVIRPQCVYIVPPPLAFYFSQ